MAERTEEVLNRLLALILGNGGSGGGFSILGGGSDGGASRVEGGITAGDITNSALGLTGVTPRVPVLDSLLPVAGLVRAFRGNSEVRSAVFEPFELPPSAAVTLGYSASESRLSAIEYGDRQTIRPAAIERSAGPQVSINVNAIDGRSILDRSEEIANAVRSALLNSHSLGEVFWED